jgi:hypothetical protein
VKSRISRARDTLERLLLEGEARPQPAIDADATVADDRSDEAGEAQAIES